MLSSETKSGELTQSTSQSVAQFSDSFQENVNSIIITCLVSQKNRPTSKLIKFDLQTD